MKRTMTLMVLALFCAMGFAQDKAKGKMIHVDFKNLEDGSSIQATLPLSLVSAAKPHIERALTQVQERKNMDFRNIWESVKDSGPTQLVEINSDEVKMKVFTTETHLKVKMDHQKDGEFDVTLPLALGDALFNEDNKNLDYDTIVNALLAMEGQDLVVVDSDVVEGRVWIE